MTMYITPQIQTVPSIPYDVLNAHHQPARCYDGHLLDGSSVQRHSTDDAYLRFGIVMVAHDAGHRRLWHAMKGDRVVAAHPRHDAARFMALALLTGA